MTRPIEIAAAAGTCPATFHVPDGPGPFPGVILFMDGPGIRPAVQEMGERLAADGFAVLVPDLFYRAGPYAPIDPKIVFTNPELREQHRKTLMSKAGSANVLADLPGFIDALRAQPETGPGPLGVVGYCMGGRLALLAAGHHPDVFGAAASFHGGNLVSDQPDSPHLLADRIRARVLVAGAAEDKSFPDQMKQALIASFEQAGVDGVVETWPAHHGWVPSDMPAHDPVQSERHWTVLPAFFRENLQLLDSRG